MKNYLKYILLVASLFTVGCAMNTDTQKPAKAIGYFSKSPVLTPFHDNYWLVLEDFIYHINDQGEQITVPAGFVTDLASVPDGANAIFDKFGRYASAGIIHDYLYWEKIYSKKQADIIIKDALKATNVGYMARNTIKWGVKLFGQKAWEDNCSERTKGLPRVIPLKFRIFNVDTKWKEYQKMLFLEKGVKSSKIQECQI